MAAGVNARVREHDGILDKDGICVGSILSSAKVGDTQAVLALCKTGSLKAGDNVGAYYVARNERHIAQGKVENCQVGEKYDSELGGVVTKRFIKY